MKKQNYIVGDETYGMNMNMVSVTGQSNDQNTMAYNYSNTWLDGDVAVISNGSDIYDTSGNFLSSEWSDSAGNRSSTTVRSDHDGNMIYYYSNTWLDGSSLVTSNTTDTYDADGNFLSSRWTDGAGSSSVTQVNIASDGTTNYYYSNTWLEGEVLLTSSSSYTYDADGNMLSAVIDDGFVITQYDSDWDILSQEVSTASHATASDGMMNFLSPDDVHSNDLLFNEDTDSVEAVQFAVLIGHQDLSVGDFSIG